MWTLKSNNNVRVFLSLSKNVYFHCLRLMSIPTALHQEVPENKWIEPKGYNTGIQIYNPILKKKVPLILNHEKCATWYSCGPTVYDSAHIGHASCYVKLDIIRRILQNYFDINVFFMMGITDIDDKIIASAAKRNEDFHKLSRQFETEFFEQLTKLNVLMPTITARVTDHIPNIINFIEKIITNGNGYAAPDGSVYFKVNSFKRYGKLRPPDTGNTSDLEYLKLSQQDFALWKTAKPEEPSWDSPWGKGRPGWHIECSAMASKIFGTNIDIHSGGIDLIFPHHENEEAQSCCHHGTSQWINYWLHTGHLFVKGDEKMSKSLKNTIKIEDFFKMYSANHFRLLCMISPYRSGIEYSQESMKNAVGNYRRIESFLSDCDLYISGVKKDGLINEGEIYKNISEAKSTIMSALRNDFDMPRVFDTIIRLVSLVNSMLQKPAEGTNRHPVAVATASSFVRLTMENFGVQFSYSKVSTEENLQMNKILDSAVEFRSIVREVALDKQMAKVASEQRKQLLQACDVFRNNLFKSGIELKDHGRGTTSWNTAQLVKEKTDE